MPALWFKNILQIKFNNTLESNASNQNLGRPGQQDKSLMLKLFYQKYFESSWNPYKWSNVALSYSRKIFIGNVGVRCSESRRYISST